MTKCYILRNAVKVIGWIFEMIDEKDDVIVITHNYTLGGGMLFSIDI